MRLLHFIILLQFKIPDMFKAPEVKSLISVFFLVVHERLDMNSP